MGAIELHGIRFYIFLLTCNKILSLFAYMYTIMGLSVVYAKKRHKNCSKKYSFKENYYHIFWTKRQIFFFKKMQNREKRIVLIRIYLQKINTNT